MKIESKRLILRNWEDSDVKDIVEGLNNIEVAKWMASVPYPYTENDAKKFIEYAKSQDENVKISLAIVLKSSNKVIGGTSKLLKYFIDVYKPKNILCFSDWNLFSGKGYEMSGFNFEGFTGPDKFYVTINNKLVRINRSPYAYQQYKQMVREGKLFECHGCGSKKFVWYASD